MCNKKIGADSYRVAPIWVLRLGLRLEDIAYA